MLFCFMLSFVTACGDDADETQNNIQNHDIQSTATIDYLCSSTFWQYLPDEGIKTGEIYETFSFLRISGKTSCTITKEKHGEDIGKSTIINKTVYSFTYNAPIVTLTDEAGNTKRTLTVYKLSRDEKNYPSDKWLLIDGKKYMGWFGGVNF